MCQVCNPFDLMVAEADAILEADYDAAFPFGECHCGCALEENGECPACIQEEIDDKAMEAAYRDLKRHAAPKYLVIDCPFNEENYPSLVGKTLDNPPSYALCVEVRG